MTDSDLQRRINRQFDVDDIKGKAALIFAGLLGVSILLAYLVGFNMTPQQRILELIPNSTREDRSDERDRDREAQAHMETRSTAPAREGNRVLQL